MCLVVWGWKVHPEYPLILIANRDETYRRPTQPLGPLEDTSPTVYAGLDQKAGGTWAGITEQGRFAALTNFRQPSEKVPTEARSRGHLVKDYLTGRQYPDAYLEHLETEAQDYAGFNLLVGNRKQLLYYSNRGERPRALRPGIYGLSNGLLHSGWPKVEESRVAFTHIISRRKPNFEQLFQMMQNAREYPTQLLPDTGLPLEQEAALSPAFIQTENYGTRSSLLMVVDHKQQATVVEKTYTPGQVPIQVSEEKQFSFDLKP